MSFKNVAWQIDVRESIAVRHVTKGKHTLHYLSLFDDEIDRRLEELLARIVWASCEKPDLAKLALQFEPTDAAIVTSANDEISVVRGGANNFPLYWATVDSSILVSTVLPVDRVRHLSVPGLLASITAVSIASQNEPNFLLATPLNGWFRCRRGVVSNLSYSRGCVSEQSIDHSYIGGIDCSRDALIESIRAALEKYGRRQKGNSLALVELSGGFDSTLAAVAARKHGVDLVGTSVRFPYYEFRFEEDIQKSVAELLGIERMTLDGEDIFAYAPSTWWPKLDEPATAIIGLKRDLEIAKIASDMGISRLLVGHGGDQLFSEDLLQNLETPSALSRGVFKRSVWCSLKNGRDRAEYQPPLLPRSTLTYLHDARLDVATKEAFGTVTRSPFTELDMAKCGLVWAALSRRVGTRLDKSILEDAFKVELPTAVTTRPGKVSWDGVCARMYAKHGDDILQEIDRVSAPLDYLGVNVKWIEKRVEELASWKKTSIGNDDKEVFAVYAVATWLRGWGITLPSDCAWSDC